MIIKISNIKTYVGYEETISKRLIVDVNATLQCQRKESFAFKKDEIYMCFSLLFNY